MKYRIALFVFLSFFLGLKLQAQETSNLKNSIGIQSNFEIRHSVISSYSIGYRTYPRLLFYFNSQLNDRFSMGVSLGFSRKSIYRYIIFPNWKRTFDEYQQHRYVELFSRIRLYGADNVEVYARPVLGYDLLEKDYKPVNKALNVSTDVGFKYTFFKRFNFILEKELIYFRYFWHSPFYNDKSKILRIDSLISGFRTGISFQF